jgi:hypothetical protein
VAVARTLLKTTVAAVRRQFYGAFVLKQWSIGRSDIAPTELLTGRTMAVAWLKSPGRTRILADPMPVPGANGDAILCESFDYKSGRGIIIRMELECGSQDFSVRASGHEPVIVDPAIHLSYPGLTRLPSREVLCVPEGAQSGSLRAYQLDQNARHVVVSTTLLEGLEALDPTIFQARGRWWLACTEEGPTSFSHLWLYHGPTPLGPWAPHASNPVVIDIRHARPAGPVFEVDNVLYRPAQNCAGGYGRAVSICQITELTPDTYSEKVVAEVWPDPDGERPHGLHTLSVEGSSVVIDGYRNVLHPFAGLYRLRARSQRGSR